MNIRFELRSHSSKRIAIVEADNIESIFKDRGRLLLVTKDAKEYRFDMLEYLYEDENV